MGEKESQNHQEVVSVFPLTPKFICPMSFTVLGTQKALEYLLDECPTIFPSEVGGRQAPAGVCQVE